LKASIHSRTDFEFFFYVMQRRDPGAHQIGGVTRPKKHLAPVKHTVIMFMPAHFRSRAEGIGDSRNRCERPES